MGDKEAACKTTLWTGSRCVCYQSLLRGRGGVRPEAGRTPWSETTPQLRVATQDRHPDWPTPPVLSLCLSSASLSIPPFVFLFLLSPSPLLPGCLSAPPAGPTPSQSSTVTAVVTLLPPENQQQAARGSFSSPPSSLHLNAVNFIIALTPDQWVSMLPVLSWTPPECGEQVCGDVIWTVAALWVEAHTTSLFTNTS